MCRKCSDYVIKGRLLTRTLCFLLLSILISGTTPAKAEELNGPSSINIIPFPASSPLTGPRTPVLTEQGSSSSDPRILKLKDRLVELKGTLAAAANAPASSRPSAKAALREEKGGRPSTASPPPARAKKTAPTRLNLSNRNTVSASQQLDASVQQSPLQPQDEVEFRMRWIGTPRQIKVNAKGVRSQQALADQSLTAATRAEQDEQSVRNFLRKYRSHLRIDDPDHELSVSRRESDDLNRRHFRFHQSYEGLRVWPAELIVHLDPDGMVDLVDGAFVPTPRKLITKPVVTAGDAIAAARADVTGGETATASDPELIVYGPLDEPSRLAWKLVLEVSADTKWLVVIDALNKQVLTSFNKVESEAAAGSGQDLYGISRPLHLWRANNIYYQTDTSKSMYDSTSVPPQPSTTRGAITITDARNQPASSNPQTVPTTYFVTSSSASSGWLRDGVSASYNLSNVYDYYKSRHSRNSIDGKGGSFYAVVRFGKGYQNAFWNSDSNAMFFGDASPYAGALDVVAHEMTHGVTSYTANLVYKNQSGALNESFSDIFGECVENFVKGSTDWEMGEDLGKPIRSLKNPSSITFTLNGVTQPYPARMGSYIKTTSDNGGVHLNSSIPNHAFYLLAAGMSGAIGVGDAERIFYRALSTHLTGQSEFLDARLACIQSAKELFGSTSTQAAKTAEAFDGVEIFDTTPPPPPDSGPSGTGPDSALFVSYDSSNSGYRLTRRETALGDSNVGNWIGSYPISPSRPAVTADGSMAAYVKANNDLCLMLTNDPSSEGCLDLPGLIHSVSISPDGDIFGFVLLGAGGEPDNQITVVDIATEQSQTYTLVAPAIDGVSLDSVDHADAMVITTNRRFVIYDALNVLKLADGSKIAAWSIYALDLVTGSTLIVVPPTENYDTAFPSIGHTSDDFITFDGYNQRTGQNTIYAGNLLSNKAVAVGTITNDYGVPSFIGDDTAIVYAVPDAPQPTKHSIYKKSLAADHMTPSGSAALWIEDGDYAVVYRRGAYNKLSVSNNDNMGGVVTSSVGGISCGDRCSYIYPTGTIVALSARTYAGSVFRGWGGACSGTGVCSITLSHDASVTATFAAAADSTAPQIASFSIPHTATSATIQITAFVAADNVAVTGYCLSEENSSSACSWSSTPPATFTFTGITPGTPATRTLYAFAKDAAGNVSSSSTDSTTIIIPVLPGAPTAVSASAGNGKATVTFTPPASNGGSPITGYTVTSNPAGGVDSDAGTTLTTHTVTGLSNGTAYTFTVTATNYVGTGPVSAASNSVTPKAAQIMTILDFLLN